MKRVIKSITPEQDISIVLCGEAGQGIQTVEQLLTRILKHAVITFLQRGNSVSGERWK